MTIVVGIGPGAPQTEAVELAAAMGVGLGSPVIAASVVVAPGGLPSPLRPGMTDEAHGELLAVRGLEEARCALGERLERVVALRERSVRAGLLRVIDDVDAQGVVLGAHEDEAGSKPGLSLSGAAHGVLHSATVPVFLAPAGYRRTDPEHPLSRLTVMFGPDDASGRALAWAASLADSVDTQLRIVTFWVRPPSTSAAAGGSDHAAQLADQWKTQINARIDTSIRGLSSLGIGSRFIDRFIVDGTDWGQAMAGVDWQPGDLLVVGSRPPTGLRSTFVGSRAREILERSPVPAVVLPG